jgi:hypothetical protein
MTPRVDKAFSEELLRRNCSVPDAQDFRETASLFPIPHPLVLKAQLSHQDSPQHDYPIRGSFLNWNLFCFENASEIPSEVKIQRAHPHVVAQILKTNPTEMALSFDQLGCVILTQNKMLLATKPGLHQLTLPLILDYAFSQDLWAPHGKWIVFHERLQKAFETAGLLLDSLPGSYSLNTKSVRLRDFGILLDEKDNHWELTLPWTFPLSELVKLEKLLTQEF